MTNDFILPAEWSPQTAILLTWPHRHGHWNDQLDAVIDNFVAIVKAITRFEAVIICCHDEEVIESTQSRLNCEAINPDRFTLLNIPNNDVWARDHGPLTTLRGDTAKLLNFEFNGWGGKYPAKLDNQITTCLHQTGLFGSTAIEKIPCVLEGGAIETDGQGVLLTTTGCLPLSTRNPGWSLKAFEALFEEQFGIHTTLWLEHGSLIGDDTDGHIDTLARFADTETIVYQACHDPEDEHFSELEMMAEQLAGFRRSDGKPYRLQPLPLPQPIFDQDGQRLPASYANFLIINHAVLMPAYGDCADSLAADILAECFPRHEIVQIDCRPLIGQYGSLHCVTMQIPAQVPLCRA